MFSSVSKAQDLNLFLLFSPHKKVNIFVLLLVSFNRTSAPRDGLFVCRVAFSVQRTEEGLAGNKHSVNIVRGGNLPSRPGMSAQWGALPLHLWSSFSVPASQLFQSEGMQDVNALRV